ncbi:MAG: lysylphosphatidylglycerol synthase transmembrane domain-containing protein [Candidatus Aenigmatarchaeota archaeon]
MKKFRFLSLLASLLIFIAIILYINPIEIADEILRIELKYLVLVFIISNLTLLVRVAKWWILLDNVYFKDVIPIQIFGITISNLTPGKFAEPIKSFLLKMKEGIPVSKSLPSVILERVLDILILIILSILGIVGTIGINRNNYSSLLIFSTIFFVFILSLMIFILINKSFGLRIFSFFKKVKFFSFLDDRFINNFYSSTKIKKRKVITSSILTIFSWLLDGLIFYLIAISLDKSLAIDLGLLFFCSTLAISIIASLLTFLPGGIGGTEALMTYILISIGFERSTAGAIVLVGRFATLGYSMILGYLSFIYLSKVLKINTNTLKLNKN